MDFTREPLIETIITPKEGFRLLIRSITASSQEEYSVLAVEVVSFGECYFFRSLEKPQAFLLPMTKYEVIEAREVRTILKKASPEKSIKIGAAKKSDILKEEDAGEEGKRREKKRLRKKHSKEMTEDPLQQAPIQREGAPVKGTQEGVGSLPKLTLLPPPKSLISDQMNRYKNYLLQKESASFEKEGNVDAQLTDDEKSELFVEDEKENFFDDPSSLENNTINGVDEKISTSPKEVS